MLQELFQYIFSEWYYLLGQGFGYLGIAVLLYAFTIKDDIKSMKVATFSILVWGTHFYLLGLDAGVYASLIALVRMYFSFNYKGNIYGMALVMCLVAISGYISYDGLISILPIISSFLAILAYQLFYGIQMRITLFICSLLWLFYSLELNSIPGVLNEIIGECVLLVTIYKIYTTDHEKTPFREKVFKKIFLGLKLKKARRRVDFGKFVIFRDKKQFLEEKNDIIYAEDGMIYDEAKNS